MFDYAAQLCTQMELAMAATIVARKFNHFFKVSLFIS